MNDDYIRIRFGPCGLLCEKCFAFADGPIRKTSVQLKDALGNFDVYAERFTALLDEPRFSKYAEFKIILNLFSEGSCRGCRPDGCKLFAGCSVKRCSAGKNVDYCFQCESFPCDNTGFDENLKQRWISIQNRMKETGIENYYNEIKDKSRY